MAQLARPESMPAFPDLTAQRGLPSALPHILIHKKAQFAQAFVPMSAPEIVLFTLATESNTNPTESGHGCFSPGTKEHGLLLSSSISQQ